MKHLTQHQASGDCELSKAKEKGQRGLQQAVLSLVAGTPPAARPGEAADKGPDLQPLRTDAPLCAQLQQ